MAQILVRKLEDDVKERLRERARRHGRSLEEEVRAILREATGEAEAPTGGLGTALAERFAGLDFDFEIPELRGEEARPATFDDDRD